MSRIYVTERGEPKRTWRQWRIILKPSCSKMCTASFLQGWVVALPKLAQIVVQ